MGPAMLLALLLAAIGAHAQGTVGSACPTTTTTGAGTGGIRTTVATAPNGRPVYVVTPTG